MKTAQKDVAGITDTEGVLFGAKIILYPEPRGHELTPFFLRVKIIIQRKEVVLTSLNIVSTYLL